MLFNSYPFILFFLPLTLASFGFARRLGYRSLSISLLLLASLIFYGYGRPDHLVLFVGTVFGTWFGTVRGTFRGFARGCTLQ